MKKSVLIAAVLLSAASAFATAGEVTIKSVEDIKKCTTDWDKDACFDAYQKFVDKNPGKALEAAKAGRGVFADWAVLPTFDKVFTQSKDVAICKDRDFQLSLVNALGQPPRLDVYKTAEKYLKNECAPYLVDIAIKELDSYAGSSETRNFCPLLKANGKNHQACEPKPAEAEPAPEVLPTVEKSKIKLDGIKAYRGPEGSMVFIGQIKGENDAYLIKFSGIKGPWNNKTILHKARQLNKGSMDYWTEYKGKDWVSVTVRDCYAGYCGMRMYAPELGNSDGLFMSYVAEKAKPQDLISTFQGK